MDSSTTPPIAASTTPDDPVRPYRAWATVLFLVVAVVGLIGIGIALAASPSVPEAAVLVVSAGVSVVTLLVMAADLGRAAPWAVHAVKPLCVLFILTGVLRSLVAMTDGGLLIPLEAIGALLVLTRPHGPELPLLLERVAI